MEEMPYLFEELRTLWRDLADAQPAPLPAVTEPGADEACRRFCLINDLYGLILKIEAACAEADPDRKILAALTEAPCSK